MVVNKNSNLIPLVCKIYFALQQDVDSISLVPDRFHRLITFKGGKIWNEIYFTPATAEFSEKPKDTEAGQLIEQSLKFIFPGEDDLNLASFDAIIGRPVLVRIQFSTGESKLIGDIGNGSKLSQVTQVSSKATGSQFEFTCTATYRSCWLSL